jgi:3-hydroxyisobutyrate dehydrogenase-like beta-hydroxyacid dehydrogenase
MAQQESDTARPRVTLIGFGEAGETFARAADWSGLARGWDLLPHRRELMAACGVEAGQNARETLADAQCVLSLVTADEALKAAQDYAIHLPSGALWLDMNSVAPGTKQAAAGAITAAGANYVDVAVMSPVDRELAVPLLLAGPQADTAHAHLAALGFSNIRVVGSEIGQASAIKLCRSVMVKGLEALTAEMVCAASAAGVLDEVLASLDASEKAISWQERADYNLDRMLLHGKRRSAEMAEAAAMLGDLNIPARMTGATVRWQDLLGALELDSIPDGLSDKLAAIRGQDPFAGEKTG